MRVDAAGGHLVGSYLRRLHEFGIDSQRRNSLLSADGIGAVNDVLLCSGNICLRGLLHGLCLRRLFWRFAGVGLARFDLYTFGIAVPVNLESYRLADVAQHDVVIAVDVVRRQADFLTVYKDAVGGKRCFQRFHRLRRGSTQRKPQHKAAEDKSGILQSVHCSTSSLMCMWKSSSQLHHITGDGQKSNRTDPAKRRKNQVSTAVTHQRWSRWLRTQV